MPNQIAPRMERRGNSGLNRLAEIVEPAITVGTNLLAEIPAYASGMIEARDTGSPAAGVRRAEEVSEMLTYNPRTMEGQAGLQSLTNSVMRVMDAVGVDEAVNYVNNTIMPNLQRTFGERTASEIGSTLLMAIPMARKVPGLQVAEIDDTKDMLFLHNTSPAAIESFDEIGGIPMPSLAVTKEDIPFEGFGEITLIGKPENFDPKTSKTNEIFSSDAYTVRAPRPMQLAKKNADDIFEQKYGTSKELDEELDIYASDIPFELSEQSVKSRANTTSFNRIKDFFLRPDARKLFALDQGYDRQKLPKRDDPLEVKSEKQQELEVFLINKDEELSEWRQNQIADLLEPEKVFVSQVQSQTDFKPRRQTMKPYTADEVTKFMRRHSGANQEKGFASSSIGAQRAATAENIKSLKEAKEKKNAIQSKEALDNLKDAQSETFFALADELEKHYKYAGGNRFGFFDEVGEVIKMSERMTLDKALETVGFENVPEELRSAINTYKDSLRDAPTQYFESKPRRTVALSEFGGAIVPKDAVPQIRKTLEKHGITNIKTYTTPEERTSARAAFKDLMFSVGLPASVATTLIFGEEEDFSA